MAATPRLILLFLVLLLTKAVHADEGSVVVKFKNDAVSLSTFKCNEVAQSFVGRVCYDEAEQRMLIKLKETWYQFCALPRTTVSDLLAAPVPGDYFNASVKGHYKCRREPKPSSN